MRRLLLIAGLSPLVGCGSVAFYETVPVGGEVEIVRDDGWRDSIRHLIQEPPPHGITAETASDDPECVDDLDALRHQVSAAIELAVAHRDWPRERCLSMTGQTVGTLYHASVGVPFVDQRGRVLRIRTECSAPQLARVAQACAS